jgi:ABC-type bacteriocin/lantibiotic exporter with double-glycine peptidase domain
LVFVVVLLNETVFRLITLEFVGVTLRLVQTLGSLNNALNSLINSQVHIEKLIEFENDKEVRLSPLTLDPSLNPDIAIKLEKVSFRYFGSEEYMFRNLNLDINKNKHTVLTGLNGTGKSTLIGLMSGIYYASEGTVKINSNKLGYVGPLPLILDSTIKENLNYGSSSPNSDEKLIELVELFDLFNGEDLDLNMKVTNKSLSSGQMQKISFIRAILADIEILFLDESTSNLDINTKDKIYSVLQNMNITIVNSTHSKDEFRYDFHLHIENIEGNRSISFK